ncbi:hypothetical protein FLA105535_03598 [Flavobacterium bizetiae]|uniref:hypothetical protein n=4 Tax=Flavobacterium bizetiae TaxID=2704140 RepID=UPI00190CF2F7|nr:hypothetical protein [Flavobacterium bizetiae]CAD5343598.1 hypothetical protein FLA105535_03598 [Flavobacterium bizetiae]
MTEIQIFKNTSSSKIKELYKKYILNEKLGEVSITIPSELTRYKFGLLADLLRFIITLNINSQIKNLKINIDIEEIDSIYDHEHIYPIISLLWNTSRFVDKDDNDIKDLLKINQNKFFNKMNSLEKLKGQKYILSHTDHLSKNNGLIKFLEDINGFNDDEDYITEIVERILNENVLLHNIKNQHELENIIKDIGAVIYELTKNTNEWGKTDVNLKPVPSSIRGMYFRFHNNGYENLLEEFSGTPINDFFQHNYIKENCIQSYSYQQNEEKIVVNTIYYLEILVYDSGVGFIEKFNDSNGLTDIEVIKKCLIKNQTSSVSNLKSKKGIGLDRILNTIDKKGFFKLMTDKYCVYRDLVKDNYSSLTLEQLNNLKLEDWNGKEFSSDSLVKCQGSYVSILYPFKKNGL